MRVVELFAASVVALILFVVVKLIGLMIQVAAIAAVIGFVAGLVLARAFRR
jgi:hypothetical protein